MTTIYIVIGCLALIGGLVLFIYKMARRLGQRDSAERENDHAQTANDIDSRVHTLSPDDRRKWLYGGK